MLTIEMFLHIIKSFAPKLTQNQNLNTCTFMLSDSSLTLRMTRTYSTFVAPKLMQNHKGFANSLHKFHTPVSN